MSRVVFTSRAVFDRLVGDGLPVGPMVHGLRRRWRRFLYMRVCFHDEAGAPCGGTMLRAERIDGHSVWLGGEYMFCLQDEEAAEDMPRGLDVFGGGRRDCCINEERLAPEALAFCRSVMRDVPLWCRDREWDAPGHATWEVIG